MSEYAYHLDEDVAVRIARLLRAVGRDVTTCHDVGLVRAKDWQQLLYAAEGRRVLLTNNRKDFELLHGAWLGWAWAWGTAAVHAGILVLDQHRPAEEIVHAIVALESAARPVPNMLYRWRAVRGWEASLIIIRQSLSPSSLS